MAGERKREKDSGRERERQYRPLLNHQHPRPKISKIFVLTSDNEENYAQIAIVYYLVFVPQYQLHEQNKGKLCI